MCELFGWSADGPVSTTKVTLEEFFKRGGLTGNHDDGWGLGVFAGGKNALLFKDSQKGAYSMLAKHLCVDNTQIQANIGIGHIRYATNGSVHSGNAHPFVREFLGRDWVFAHNGVVSTAFNLINSGDRFVPTGATDSEHLFCNILNRLAKKYTSIPKKNDIEASNLLHKEIATIAKESGGSGRFNMLLSNGVDLFARKDDRLSICLTEKVIDDSKRTIAFIATNPTNVGASWEQDTRNRLWVLRDGSLINVLNS